jgi:hypothetical protein
LDIERRERKTRITETETRSMRRNAKITWIEYKRNEDILRELRINSGKKA